MKATWLTRTFILGLLTLFAVFQIGCVRQRVSSFGQEREHHPTAAELKHCPYGHTTLTNVPIWYGLPDFSDATSVSNDLRAQENLEYVSGGCCVEPDSPTTEVWCVTCRFSTDSDLWQRSSPIRESFRHPFTSIITNFPIPPKHAIVGLIDYGQGLRDGKVEYESINYTTREAPALVLSRLTNWLGSFTIKVYGINGQQGTVNKTGPNNYTWYVDPEIHVGLFQREDGSSDVSLSDFEP